MANKKSLLGYSLIELEQVIAALNMPAFTAKQIADWLYKKQVRTIDDMSNISSANRAKLAKKYKVGCTAPIEVTRSKDRTKKYLFDAGKSQSVEAVFIPEKERKTLCISSQVGCQMDCLFCATGKQGFTGNLSVSQILDQVQSIDETEELSNIVFMGMGEPLNNLDEVLRAIEVMTADWGYGWSPKRITVSTIGVLPKLRRFLDETQCNIAISLHSPQSFIRKQLVPAEKVYPIEKVIALLKEYDWSHQRRISFAYTLFDQLNDTEENAIQVAELLRGILCRINLIPYHPIPGVGLTGSNRVTMEKFQRILMRNAFTTTIRRSRGKDISAACGMLSTKKAEETLAAKEELENK